MTPGRGGGVLFFTGPRTAGLEPCQHSGGSYITASFFFFFPGIWVLLLMCDLQQELPASAAGLFTGGRRVGARSSRGAASGEAPSVCPCRPEAVPNSCVCTTRLRENALLKSAFHC